LLTVLLDTQLARAYKADMTKRTGISAAAFMASYSNAGHVEPSPCVAEVVGPRVLPLTKMEQQKAMVDAGIDTHEEKEGER
jgi:hypothetical protein